MKLTRCHDYPNGWRGWGNRKYDGQGGIVSDSEETSRNRSTEGCSKLKSPEKRQVQERLVSTSEHLQVPKWDRTRCPEE